MKSLQLVDLLNKDSMVAYLRNTDYAIIKINEAIITGDNELAESLKETYAEVIQKRIKVRNDMSNENYYRVE